jgi:hypothetical protein
LLEHDRSRTKCDRESTEMAAFGRPDIAKSPIHSEKSTQSASKVCHGLPRSATVCHLGGIGIRGSGGFPCGKPLTGGFWRGKETWRGFGIISAKIGSKPIKIGRQGVGLVRNGELRDWSRQVAKTAAGLPRKRKKPPAVARGGVGQLVRSSVLLQDLKTPRTILLQSGKFRLSPERAQKWSRRESNRRLALYTKVVFPQCAKMLRIER